MIDLCLARQLQRSLLKPPDISFLKRVLLDGGGGVGAKKGEDEKSGMQSRDEDESTQLSHSHAVAHARLIATHSIGFLPDCST